MLHEVTDKSVAVGFGISDPIAVCPSTVFCALMHFLPCVPKYIEAFDIQELAFNYLSRRI